ncbi:hypothetical protein Pelo_19075 [Pelomyxa schiedti]|nr:hypothetical protein Pelo_19075 [Pelomyxa schiedti]
MMRGALDSVWQLSAKVCGNGAGGGSKFLKAFEKAFDILTASYTTNHTSFCGATIVLVTDGDIKEDHPTLLDSISEMRNTYEQNCQPLSIFTYSFTVRGNDEDVIRKIACQNDGLWIRIEDQIDPWMISAVFDVYTFAREAATTTYTQASVWWNTPYDALYIDDDEATPASVAALPVYANSNGTYPAQLVAVVTYTVLLDQFLAADPNMTENIVTSDQYQLSPLYYYLMYHGDSAEKLCTNTKLSYDQLQYLRSKLATEVCSPGDFDLGSEAEHAINPLPEEYWIPSEESLCPTNETSSAIVCDTPTFHPDEWGQELCCTDNPAGCPLEGSESSHQLLSN